MSGLSRCGVQVFIPVLLHRSTDLPVPVPALLWSSWLVLRSTGHKYSVPVFYLSFPYSYLAYFCYLLDWDWQQRKPWIRPRAYGYGRVSVAFCPIQLGLYLLAT
ncbi:hypothetical protein BCR33DRAFT_516878 [Rhizoclosmatium globosum]|uniref:Uncharacterized protein n=1 Tax=Rhizoclosmatium globosum TaxID=329046 RepID=A0A1Y2BGA9_9FUNG|nr:hypothetical protein BCR33DRAFT_516878 [Rhizoclosmatium globosum]|eukprot:ORY33858.1 hypothetical protein BCR33DRAFT_516878 [Rhizoclosmatium globosum]